MRLSTTYDPSRIPAQAMFRRSRADIIAYGGAMGGGKTRALTELAFDYALEYPSIMLPIFRSTHTHIVGTSRRTFFEQVLPAELRGRKDLIRVKQSQGEDFVEFLWNGSQIHFVGLDDPGRVFSAEFGAAMFDEAHEIREEDVLTVNTRLRQRCRKCIHQNIADCQHMPYKMLFAFNPTFPGHWIDQWFRLGAERSEFGYRKAEVIPQDAEGSIGSAEFFIAKAQDNPFLRPGYVDKNLAGLSKLMRQRYLEGKWLHISGHGFFDEDAVGNLQESAELERPLLVGEPVGDLTGADEKNRPRLTERLTGRLQVFRAPVRAHVEQDGTEVPSHRYIVGIDPSSGASADFSGIQVFDVNEFEQVAEWQGKIDPDTLAELAFLLGCVYNGAMVVPETTGGWGHSVQQRLMKLGAGWKGPAASKPKPYLNPRLGRLAAKFTDRLGWDTNTASRSLMLATLEAEVREETITIHGTRTVAELAAFAFPQAKPGMDYRAPRAQPGQHDDLVMALAIAVTVASRSPRQAVRMPERNDNVAFSAAGY